MSTLEELDTLLDSMDLESGFLAYLSRSGVTVDPHQWEISGDIVLVQLRALVGRYSPLDDRAFYPIIAAVDNVIEAALAG